MQLTRSNPWKNAENDLFDTLSHVIIVQHTQWRSTQAAEGTGFENQQTWKRARVRTPPSPPKKNGSFDTLRIMIAVFVLLTKPSKGIGINAFLFSAVCPVRLKPSCWAVWQLSLAFCKRKLWICPRSSFRKHKYHSLWQSWKATHLCVPPFKVPNWTCGEIVCYRRSQRNYLGYNIDFFRIQLMPHGRGSWVSSLLWVTLDPW